MRQGKRRGREVEGCTKEGREVKEEVKKRKKIACDMNRCYLYCAFLLIIRVFLIRKQVLVVFLTFYKIKKNS